MSIADPVSLSFEGLTLDPAARILADAGAERVPLRRSEFELLLAFVEKPGRVLSRDYLLEAVAGCPAEVFDRSAKGDACDLEMRAQGVWGARVAALAEEPPSAVRPSPVDWLLRVGVGGIGIELDRPVEVVERPLMAPLCAADEAVCKMRRGQGRIDLSGFRQCLFRPPEQILSASELCLASFQSFK